MCRPAGEYRRPKFPLGCGAGLQPLDDLNRSQASLPLANCTSVAHRRDDAVPCHKFPLVRLRDTLKQMVVIYHKVIPQHSPAVYLKIAVLYPRPPIGTSLDALAHARADPNSKIFCAACPTRYPFTHL